MDPDSLSYEELGKTIMPPIGDFGGKYLSVVPLDYCVWLFDKEILGENYRSILKAWLEHPRNIQRAEKIRRIRQASKVSKAPSLPKRKRRRGWRSRAARMMTGL